MSAIPNRVRHWAEEAYHSMLKAWEMLEQKYPKPSSREKLHLITYAAVICGINRQVKDKDKLNTIAWHVYDKQAQDMVKHRDHSFSVKFLMAYLDANVHLGVISEKRALEVMQHLADNFDLSIKT